MSKWWSKSASDVVKLFTSNISLGLNDADARERLKKYGLNRLNEGRQISALKIFLSQFNDFMMWILAGAGLVSGFLGEWVDAGAIVAIIFLNACLGFIQEYRAEKSLAALKKLSSPNSKVIRDGKRVSIPSEQIVPGDIIEIEIGDNIPADGRVLWLTSNFSVGEASLTGESTPVIKTHQTLNNQDISLADRINMVYMGTHVSSGRAVVIATETGMNTELGKIAGMIQEIGMEDTPLQKRLESFGKFIVLACFIMVGIVFALGIMRGGNIFDVFLTSVSLAVAAIPEGLPAVVTIALALGVQRMVKRHVLIRKLPSVETLGSVTVICSDKTGTLTRNEMTVRKIFAGGKMFDVSGVGYAPSGEFLMDSKSVNTASFPELLKIFEISVLCNSADLNADNGVYKILGDPTEGALLTLAGKAGIIKSDKEKEFKFIDEIPFDSNRKKMTVIREKENVSIAFIKGAPDIILKDCETVYENGVERKITQKDREEINKINTLFGDSAMRVLAVAYKKIEKKPDREQILSVEKSVTFAGLIAMMDPPREEVKLAIKDCESAGIKTVMITGDHKNTAVAIARELGFFKENSIALSGEELDSMDELSFKKNVENISVYARVAPEHKLKIVKAWREKGAVTAMTGDGVNDAPAIKESDIGVAMGITGTDVTKEVSDMVITDDNFASIVSAVEEGRGIYENIKKFIHYLFSCNAGEILVMFIAVFAGFPSPLLPIHILWVNLVTDGLPALALGVDSVTSGIMKQKPRRSNEPIVSKNRAILIIVQGLLIALCSLGAFYFVFFIEDRGLARARTAAFIVLAVSQLFHSFNCRSTSESLFKLGIFTNKKLILAVAGSFILQVAVVQIPFLQRVFKTETLVFFEWVIVVSISLIPFLVMELAKRNTVLRAILSRV
ncbi:cation-transporting ATPase [Candidatus Omnitrophus magneticus]|uniref:Cation-transporting ATPase n=1 Tax=Candidatus Omnitrophus magneticus TaxID=1609969 RepID=A0A0F0CMM3_9BACT|nr:cation-transporting ATPase [Candidatus Omnitrophus magneticus]